jgi:hypothetical protein
MTDWADVATSASAGLVGAGIGVFGALRAASKGAEAARDLAREERIADERERRAELTRSAAGTIRTVVTDALTRMFNIPTAEARERARSMDSAAAASVVEGAKAAHTAVLEVVRRDAYLLPDEVRSRLDVLYRLMGRATFGVLQDELVGVDVQAYGHYLDLSLRAVVRNEEVPAYVEPPDLDDHGRAQWVPNPLPVGWEK